MSDHTLGSGPIEPNLQILMNTLAGILDRTFNRGGDREVGFVLMTFPFGASEGRCNYISNAQREDIITLLTEQLAYFKGMPETKGSA